MILAGLFKVSGKLIYLVNIQRGGGVGGNQAPCWGRGKSCSLSGYLVLTSVEELWIAPHKPTHVGGSQNDFVCCSRLVGNSASGFVCAPVFPLAPLYFLTLGREPDGPFGRGVAF